MYYMLYINPYVSEVDDERDDDDIGDDEDEGLTRLGAKTKTIKLFDARLTAS